MKRLGVSLLACLIAGTVQAAPILGEGPFPFGSDYQDVEPVRIKIDIEPVVDLNATFTVDFENFSYEPGEASALPTDYADGKRRPNAGHFHVYASLTSNEWNTTNVFLGAPAATLIEPGTVEFSIPFPETGEYLLFVEAQYDDHTSRERVHPQQFGAFDFATVTVVPEPSGGVMFLIGAGLFFLAFGGRPNRRRE